MQIKDKSIHLTAYHVLSWSQKKKLKALKSIPGHHFAVFTYYLKH